LTTQAQTQSALRLKTGIEPSAFEIALSIRSGSFKLAIPTMHWFALLLDGVSVALEVWILTLLRRRNLHRRFPVFTAYIVFTILATILRSAFLSNYRIYFYVYWMTAPADVFLAVAAVYESFFKVYGTFYRVWWIRLLFPSTILAALAYSIWAAQPHPPVHFSGWNATLLKLVIVVQYVIIGICVLFFVVMRFINVRWRLYEFRFVLGFGISACVTALAGIFRSEFGTRYSFLTEQGPGVAYLVAVFIWLSAVLGREPNNGHTLVGRRPTQELLSELRGHLKVIRRFLGKE
jgi:hypothetical protein